MVTETVHSLFDGLG